MDETMAAVWLNTAFAGFDQVGLGFLHQLALAAGWLLTPLFQIVTLLGEKGACFLVSALALMVSKRMRRAGACVLLAVCLGALVTNVLLKDAIARPRPFEELALYADWWRFVGAPFEDGPSFPSGHMTAAAAAMTAWMLARRSWKATLAGVCVIVLMGVARCYLVAHYPTDVLAGCLVGALAGLIAWKLTGWYFARRDSRLAGRSRVRARIRR